MRGVVVLYLVSACGRIGFDATGDGGTGDAPIVGRWQRAGASGDTTCGITLTGELWCWGFGLYGQAGNGRDLLRTITRVGSDTDWTFVDIGDSSSCGMRGDSTLWCFGANYFSAIPGAQQNEQVNTPRRIGTGTWQQLALNDNHGCAIDSANGLSCWGYGATATLGSGGTTDQTVATKVMPTGTTLWKAIATSVVTSCGIQSDDTLWCWGENALGQVGDNTRTTRLSPVQVGSGRTWIAVATGTAHTCAIEQGGQLWCWGYNLLGQLGNGSTSNVPQLVPAPATMVPPLVEVSLGRVHSCGRTTAGELLCWGDGERGQLGRSIALSPVPLTIALFGQQVVASQDTTCFIDGDAHLACSGANNWAQITPPPGLRTTVVQSDTRTDWARVVAQGEHICGMTNTEQVICWGINRTGELGSGVREDHAVPVATGTAASSIAIGYLSTYLLAADGSVSIAGQHPDLTTEYLAPTLYTGPGTTKAVAVGDIHACRIQANDAIVCGGRNTHGQLGDGTMVDKQAATLAGTWKVLGAGYNVSCAVNTADALYCWGDNSSGQLGIGGTNDSLVPQLVSIPLANGPVSEIAMGIDFTCALTTGGQIWCWGGGDFGQLGTGSVGGATTPQRVGTATDWTKLVAGDVHACALKADHSLWCWGHSDEGQGGPALVDKTIPIQVGTTGDWGDVASGAHFTCGIKLDGTRWCFGSNANGQLGTGTAWREQFTVIP